MKIKISTLIFLLAYFPYVSFGTNNLDMQPWLFILCAALIFFSKFKKQEFLWIAIPCALAIASQLISSLISEDFDFFYFIRGFVAYFTFGFIVAFIINSSNKADQYYTLLRRSNIAYILAAVIQKLYDPNVLNILLTARTSDSRGVTSFCHEPTLFGLILLLFIALNLLHLNINNKKQVRNLIAVNVVSIFVLAISSTAALLLFLIVFMLAILNNRKILFYLCGIFCVVYLIPLAATNLEDSRMSNIFDSIYHLEFSALIERDESVYDRLMAVVYPPLASYDNYFIPGGFNLTASLPEVSIESNILSAYFYHPGNKIMSGWGALIAETGILGFVFVIFGIAYIFRKSSLLSVTDRNIVRAAAIIVIAVMISSVSLGLPLIPIIIGMIFIKIHAGSRANHFSISTK